jgi:hypothetical protein
MIKVPVSGYQMVDLAESCIVDGGHYASRITFGRAEMTGIHQKRFSGRRYEKRRIAAFNVDDIDVECPR